MKQYTARELYRIGWAMYRHIHGATMDIFLKGAWERFANDNPTVAQNVVKTYEARTYQPPVSLFIRMKKRVEAHRQVMRDRDTKRSIMDYLQDRVDRFEAVLESRGRDHEADPEVLLIDFKKLHVLAVNNLKTQRPDASTSSR